MFSWKVTLLFFSLFMLISCQTPGNNPVVIPSTSSSPSDSPVTTPSPSATGSHDIQPILTFALNTSQPCVGDTVTIRLTDSNLNQGDLSISMQRGLVSALPTQQEGGNKKPAPAFEDTVYLGQLPVSPSGQGTFFFPLKAEYTTRKGDRLLIQPGQRYLLYWEPRPGAFSYIGDFIRCSMP